MPAPQKKKVKAEGETKFQYDSFWKVFGVMFKKMELSEKVAICSILLDSYSLEIFEKGRILKIFLEILKSLELDPDDYDRYEENPIQPILMENCGFLRVFIGSPLLLKPFFYSF